MEQTKQLQQMYKYIPWIVGGAMSLVAIVGAGMALSWKFTPIDSYTLFPILGLLAFSLMLSHYIVAELKRLYKPIAEYKFRKYYQITTWVVLALILLHPGILIWQLWRDGAGLPPNSYLNYVGSAGKLAVMLGAVSLICFLLYELKHRFEKASWWPVIVYLNHAAMILIVIHALKLGSTFATQTWMKTLWFVYAGILLICIAHGEYLKYSAKSSTTK